MKQIETSTVDLTTCPDWGKGGQYVIDPVTGIRSRVSVPPEVTPVLDADVSDDASAMSVTTKTKSSNSSNKQEKTRE